MENEKIEIEEIPSKTNLTEKPGRNIDYIVIHYTAGFTSKKGSAANIARWFDKESAKAASDFIVDDETIVQLNTDIENYYCHHCGGDAHPETGGATLHGIATNANSIGIEVCSYNTENQMLHANDKSWGYTDAVLDNAVKLTRYLMAKYNIPLERVIRHYDVTGKLCPGIIGWNAATGSEEKWFAFKERLK